MTSLLPLKSDANAERDADVSGDTQDVIFLRMVWRFILFVVVPVLIIRLVFTGEAIKWNWIAIPNIALIGLFICYAVRINRVALANHTLSWGLLLMLSIQCLLASGIRSPAVMAYPVVLTVSGWLLGRKAALAMLVVTLAFLTALTLLDSVFWHGPQVRTSVTYWITAALVCGLATILAVHVAESNRRKHETARDAGLELAKRLDELQATRDKLATLVSLNPVPVSVTRIDDGTYCDANPAWARISGWSRGEMIGKTSSELGIWITAEDRQAFASTLQRDGHVFNYMSSFRMRNGEIRHFLLNSELVDYDGEPCIFSAFADITERRVAEASLERLNAGLELRVAERTASLSDALDTLRRAQDELMQSDRLASLGALVAGVAHELNTPIGNAVLITSTLAADMRVLEQSFQGGELRKSALDAFLEDAKRAASLLEQSLQQARDLVSSFKQVAIDQSSERRRSFALTALVRDISDTIRTGLRHEIWRLETDLMTDAQMDSYPGPLGQVIANLVQNAFFHGLQERVPGVVRIETHALDDECVEVRVSDNGCGIPPENIGRIFDPFFTTRLGQGGSGLGLSIVYRLVNTLLGGRISVASTPGEGTCFTVVLPLQAPVST